MPTTDLDQKQALIDESSLEFEVKSPEKALSFFHLIRGEMAEKYKIQVGFAHEQVNVEENEYSGKLYFSKEGKLSVSFGFKNGEKDLEILNFPSWLKPICVGLDLSLIHI